MKLKVITLQLVILLTLFPFLYSQGQTRQIITLQTGWKFSKGNFPHAEQAKFDDTKWNDVTVPHDWAISGPTIVDGDSNTGKLPWKGEGWYRRGLEIPADYTGKNIILIFDGIMSKPEVFVNGQLAGKWDYGYNSFYLDITKFIQFKGKNELAIHVDTREHDSRWYPGAGIYRKVQMVVVDPVHVGVWGTQITIPVVKVNYADVRIMTKVINNSSNNEEKIKVENIIVNSKGNEVARKEAVAKIAAGASKDIETTIGVSNPQRWDVTNPILYQVKTNIYKGDKLVDSSISPFGIRTIRMTANNGLYLNDKRVQLKGVNLHQDQGPLGSAFYPRAMERQIEIMKSMGCNAIRTSHNMAAPELLELCDKMGLLVFDEAFDKYDKKVDIDENTDFEDYAHRNIQNFVERDRNHPCVFIWSVGNEMADVQYNNNNGFQKLQTMINYVRKYDPTRPVTMACDNTNSAAWRHFDFYDVHSWNYGRRYSMARQMEPNKGVIVSESGSTVSTRGFYELPLPVKRDEFSKALQVSSYDLNVPYWADLPDEDFMWQQDEEYVAGEFVWTGFDYLGEPSPYTNDWAKGHGLTDKDASRSSYFGIVDLCGIPKDRYYLYKSYWKQDETTVHILPHWNWEGGKVTNVPVFVYTNGDCAELFLNGKSLGKKCKNPTSEKAIERFRLMWNDVTYQAGELKAVAYKEGEVIGQEILRTAGEPYQIRLTPDRSTIHGDGMDLSYILVEALDKDGNLCPLATNKMDLSITGPGRIAGVGNGNPQSFDPFQANYVNLFYGKAMIIVGSGFEKGTVTINATSGSLMKDTKQIKVE
ncbi:MAG TPA: glycoside hydrolase family 2 [Prolixibacteraceae bacterium]|jgi:beta-galactosidase|nr:glycoside hydrolase family 2 [Prolixibacteraceae bacterium]